VSDRRAAIEPTFGGFPRSRAALRARAETGRRAPAAAEQVRDFYLQTEGKEHAEQTEGSLTFSHGDRLLPIRRASAQDYPHGGAHPSPEDKTVLIVSQAIWPK